MDSMTYVDLDLHKHSVAYCVTTPSGEIVDEGTVLSSRAALVVGQKLVAYLMVVDKRGTAFEDRASRAGGEGLAA